jgi:hypothetical protein
MWRGRSCFARIHAGQASWNLRHCDCQCARSIETSGEAAGDISPQPTVAAAWRFRARVQIRAQTFLRIAYGILCAADRRAAERESAGDTRASSWIHGGARAGRSGRTQSHEAAAARGGAAFGAAGGSRYGCGDQSEEDIAHHGVRRGAERSAAGFRSGKEEQLSVASAQLPEKDRNQGFEAASLIG